MSTLTICDRINPHFDCTALKEKGKNVLKWGVNIWDKHSDLVQSIGILAITTSLLAAKIFKSIPPLLPRLATVVYNYGGIWWLNLQIRDFLKSYRDLSHTLNNRDWKGIIETAAKVLVKGINILLTCAIFAASISALCGYPQIATAFYLAMRPIGLTTLIITIFNDINDYFANKRLLRDLEKIIEQSRSGQEIAKTIICFKKIIFQSKPLEETLAWKNERTLAELLVRRLDCWTIETFKEELSKPPQVDRIRQEAERVFFAIEVGLHQTQARTKAGLFLTGLGYLSMGIGKAFPESLVEMTMRWGMSVFHTDQLINRKLDQQDLARVLTPG